MPGRWHLHSARHDALAGQLLGVRARQRRPGEAHADAVEVRAHLPLRMPQAFQGIGGEPVVARPEDDPQVGDRSPAVGRVGVHPARWARGRAGGAHAKAVPDGQGRRPEDGAGIMGGRPVRA